MLARYQHEDDERPLGIHSLIADHKEKRFTQERIVRTLLDEVIDDVDSNPREIRTSAYTHSDEYLQTLLVAKGFKRTHHIGYPVANVRQELYIRPKQVVLPGVDTL